MRANVAGIRLPAPLRPSARLTVLDITEWFGETSGGVRTYLLQKGEYVRRHPELRQVLVIPGAEDSVTDGDGVRCYRLRGPRIPKQQQYRFLLATRSLRRIMQHEQPDVVEIGSQMLVPWLTRFAVRGRATPLVGFYHGSVERTLLDAGTNARRLWHPAARAMLAGYVRAMDGLFGARIAASDFMVDDLRRAGVAGVARIPLGVDLSSFHPTRRQQSLATRARLGVPPDAPLAVYVGRIAREKEIALAARAWPNVARRTGAVLAIAGAGPLLRELRRCAGHESIRWLPFEPDRGRVADLLAAADLCLSPGSIESFGLAPLEAMASGTPVLTADRGGVAELVKRSGGGSLFAAGDARAFADAASVLLLSSAEHRAVLGGRGRAYAEREHDWDVVFDRVFDLYRTLVPV